MADLLDLSRRIIDEGSDESPTRVNLELSEVADGIAVIESFSNVVAMRTDDGLVLFDTSLAAFADPVLAALRGWTDEPVRTVVYTHGHVDHVGGAAAVLSEAERNGQPAPEVVAHEAVPERFARYRRTLGYNGWINARQFGGTGLTGKGSESAGAPPLFPKHFVEPTLTYADQLRMVGGDLGIDLHHDRGETDDHTWAWLPEHRAIAIGDLFIWCFPNAGNPQKVQRYPLDWALALRRMAALEPELLLPAHGLPIGGAARIRRVLDDVAGALESLVDQTLAAMNEGLSLDAVVAEVHLDDELLELPWMRPVYDEPEFVIRNIWRLYGGWYDGNPARLKPAPDVRVAGEVADLVGGADRLVERARQLASPAASGPDADEEHDADLRLACHLVEMAAAAAPDDREALAARAEIYRLRREREQSLMAKGIFGHAAWEAEQRLADGHDAPAGTGDRSS